MRDFHVEDVYGSYVKPTNVWFKIPKVYVAGSSGDLPWVEFIQTQLKNFGCIITKNWAKKIHEQGFELTFEQAETDAVEDLQAIDEADVLILTHSIYSRNSPGKWTEFGYAIAKNKPVILLCDSKESEEEIRKTRWIFIHTENVKRITSNIDNALQYLKSLDDSAEKEVELASING